MTDDEIKNFDDLEEVNPDSSDSILCGRGRIAFLAFMQLMKTDIDAATELVEEYMDSTEEFKDAVLSAKDDALQAKEDVLTAKSLIDTVKTEILEAKTAVETAYADTTTAKDTAIANAEITTEKAEAIQEIWQEITDDTADALSDIEEAKSNALNNINTSGDIPQRVTTLENYGLQESRKIGKFYLNAGEMSSSNVDLLGDYFNTFSICLSINKDFTGTIFNYYNLDDDNVINDYFKASISEYVISISSSENEEIISYDFSEITSENLAIVISSDGSTLKLYINSIECETSSLNNDIPTGTNTLSFGSSDDAYGQMWSIKAFNFDLSDELSPYTVNQYTNGEAQEACLNSQIMQSLSPNLDADKYNTAGGLGWDIEYEEGLANKVTNGDWSMLRTDSEIRYCQSISETPPSGGDTALKYGSEYIYAHGVNNDYFHQDLSETNSNYIRLRFDYQKYESNSSSNIWRGLTFRFTTRDNAFGDKSTTSRYYDSDGINWSDEYLNIWQTYDKIWTKKALAPNGEYPYYNQIAFACATDVTLLANISVASLNTIIDLDDFSVKENDTTRQVLDSSTNLNAFIITGDLSGDKDANKDRYQQYITTQITQEINLGE